MRFFKEGFQKALEILGDKKFSEDELKLAFFHVQNKPTFAVFKESLQETEWDVEIEMICPHPKDTYVCGIQYGCDEDGCNHPNTIPLLDENGCLILKRK
jgi:hypothetical protein